MKLKDKYRSLQDERFVRDMVTRSVFGTMQLEGQGVSMQKIKQLYAEVTAKHNSTPKPGAAA